MGFTGWFRFLSSLLTFLNVWLTARLMFASQHDLLLATVLLIFAGGIAMALGYFLSGSITSRLQRLETAAGQITEGDLSVVVAVEGQDELASLAYTLTKCRLSCAWHLKNKRNWNSSVPT